MQSMLISDKAKKHPLLSSKSNKLHLGLVYVKKGEEQSQYLQPFVGDL